MSDELPVSISDGENVHSWYFTSQELFNGLYKKFESEYIKCAQSSTHERCETSWSEEYIEKSLPMYNDSLHILLQFYISHFKDLNIMETFLFDLSHLVNNENLRFIIGTILILTCENVSHIQPEQLSKWNCVIDNWIRCFENSLYDPILNPDIFADFKIMAKLFKSLNTDPSMMEYITSLESDANEAYGDHNDC
jgi:hypothetical protein